MTAFSLSARTDFAAAKAEIERAIQLNAPLLSAAAGQERARRNLARVRLNEQLDRIDFAKDEWERSQLDPTEAERKLSNIARRANEFAGQVQRLEDFLKKIATVTGNITRLIGALRGG